MNRVPAALAALGWALMALGITLYWQASRHGEVLEGSYVPLLPPGGRDVIDSYQSVLRLEFDSAVVWNRGHLLGAGLAVAGLLVLAALAGWWFGRRRSGFPAS